MKGAGCYAPAAIALVLAGCIAAQAQPQSASQRMMPELLRPHLLRLHDGRRLNIHCIGKGSPTVVFEQGGEGMVFNWRKVQPAISAMTRTCFYDRGGFGWSDPPQYPVTAISVTDDLHELLRRGAVKRPIVLVGHSVGGFYATMYADRFPKDVAGLVLIDPGYSGQGHCGSAEGRTAAQAYNRRGEGYLVRCAEFARRGELNASNLENNNCFALPADVKDPAEVQYALHAITRPDWYEAEHSQSVNYFSGDDDLSVSHQQERDARRDFGDMPVVVLSRESWTPLPWPAPTADTQACKAEWRSGQAAVAARSSIGQFQVVPRSGHFIQDDRPDVVIDAVRKVVATLRGDS